MSKRSAEPLARGQRARAAHGRPAARCAIVGVTILCCRSRRKITIAAENGRLGSGA